MKTVGNQFSNRSNPVGKWCTIIEITCIPCRQPQPLFIHKVSSAGKWHISASSTLESATYAVFWTLENNRKKWVILWAGGGWFHHDDDLCSSFKVLHVRRGLSTNLQESNFVTQSSCICFTIFIYSYKAVIETNQDQAQTWMNMVRLQHIRSIRNNFYTEWVFLVFPYIFLPSKI